MDNDLDYSHHVLIVEDELKLVALLKQRLSELYMISTFTSFDELEAASRLSSIPYDVIVLDRMMNGFDTLQMISTLKVKFPQCRILVLSAINTPDEKAAAINIGADDYLSKPFSFAELEARIRALTRHPPNELRFGSISINTIDRVARVDDEVLPLSTKEFLLLRTLIHSPGKVFSKAQLCKEVWQMSTEVETNAIENTVNKLRRKLEDAGSPALIKNSRLLGYWIEE